MNKVENLKKIYLSLEAGKSKEHMDLRLSKPEFEFLFGIGPTGMTPFEYELVDKEEGDEILLRVQKDSVQVFFEHLHPPIMNLLEERKDVYLKVKIEKIIPAENREVVKAMAELTAHGHGCDCGCGC